MHTNFERIFQAFDDFGKIYLNSQQHRFSLTSGTQEQKFLAKQTSFRNEFDFFEVKIALWFFSVFNFMFLNQLFSNVFFQWYHWWKFNYHCFFVCFVLYLTRFIVSSEILLKEGNKDPFVFLFYIRILFSLNYDSIWCQISLIN